MKLLFFSLLIFCCSFQSAQSMNAHNEKAVDNKYNACLVNCCYSTFGRRYPALCKNRCKKNHKEDIAFASSKSQIEDGFQFCLRSCATRLGKPSNARLKCEKQCLEKQEKAFSALLGRDETNEYASYNGSYGDFGGSLDGSIAGGMS